MFNVSDILSGFGEELSFRQNPYIFTDSQVKVESLAHDILNHSVESQVILSALTDLGKEFSGAEDIFLDAFFHIKAGEDQDLLHTSNTMFLAQAICRWLKFSGEDVLNSMKISLFMDIAFLKKNINQAGPEAPISAGTDINAIHQDLGAGLFSKLFPGEKETSFFIRNHHCYKPGEFYAASDSLRRVFGIVALSDLFEAQIHARPDKGALRPREALKNAVAEFLSIDKAALLDFVRFIGSYPITTTVSLSTREKAVVVAQNKGYPLRPKLKLLNEAAANKEKVIDLLNEKDIYIAESLL